MECRLSNGRPYSYGCSGRLGDGLLLATHRWWASFWLLVPEGWLSEAVTIGPSFVTATSRVLASPTWANNQPESTSATMSVKNPPVYITELLAATSEINRRCLLEVRVGPTSHLQVCDKEQLSLGLSDELRGGTMGPVVPSPPDRELPGFTASPIYWRPCVSNNKVSRKTRSREHFSK